MQTLMPEHLKMILAAPAVPIVMGKTGWVTSHDLVRTLQKLETAIEGFAADIELSVKKLDNVLDED